MYNYTLNNSHVTYFSLYLLVAYLSNFYFLRKNLEEFPSFPEDESFMESSILALIWPITWTYLGLTSLSKKKAVINHFKTKV